LKIVRLIGEQGKIKKYLYNLWKIEDGFRPFCRKEVGKRKAEPQRNENSGQPAAAGGFCFFSGPSAGFRSKKAGVRKINPRRRFFRTNKKHPVRFTRGQDAFAV